MRAEAMRTGKTRMIDQRENNHLLTVRQAAAYIQRSESWLYEALKRSPEEDGSVPHVRLPGRRGGARFDRAELLEWLRTGAPPAAVWEELKSGRRNKSKPF